MPIYEYQCRNCNHHLEELQSFNEAPLTQCPACGKAKLQRLISVPSFQLKGSGWYVTDFRDKKSSANSTEKPAETTASSTDKAETKSNDTTPATTTSTADSSGSKQGAT